MNAVFDISPTSRYRKEFWRLYDLPNRASVEIAQKCIGDWIVFRETGERGYFAVARVLGIVPDGDRDGRFIAEIGDYLPFTSPSPFKAADKYAEERFRLIGRRIHIGREIQGKPVREIWATDFNAIVQTGFSKTLSIKDGEIAIAADPEGFAEAPSDALTFEPTPRTLSQILLSRPHRDASFRLDVCGRYGYKCAFTQLSLHDGRHYEVQGAHIVGVQEGGPDIVDNGLCACSIIHWAWDRYLISLDEMYRPLVAADAIDPRFLSLFPAPGESIHLPARLTDWPGEAFLAHHRSIFRRKHEGSRSGQIRT